MILHCIPCMKPTGKISHNGHIILYSLDERERERVHVRMCVAIIADPNIIISQISDINTSNISITVTARIILLLYILRISITYNLCS